MGNKWMEDLRERIRTFLKKEPASREKGEGQTEGKMGRKQYLLIFLLAGILLLVVAIPVSDTQKNADMDGTDSLTATAAQGEESSSQVIEQKAYEAYLEEKTEKLLESVEGVGKVQVMITLKSSGQKVIEKDHQNSSQSVQEKDSQGGTRDTQESSSERTSIYSQGADGTQSPYVSKELLPEVEGVVVIAEGGDNAVVAQNLTEAVQALFGVEAHKIKIMKRVHT